MKQRYERWLCISALILFALWCLINARAVYLVAEEILDLLSPVLVGIVLALILNPLLCLLERLWDRTVRRPLPRLRRVVCLLLTVLLAIGALVLLILLLLPRLFSALTEVLTVIPAGVERLWALWDAWELPPSIQKPEMSELGAYLGAWIREYGARWMEATASAMLGLLGGMLDTAVAAILSIYLLAEKERLKRQVRYLLSLILPERGVGAVTHVATLFYQTFCRFLAGQAIETTVLGALCFLGMTLLRIPYALLASVIVGLSAWIPIFGAFIGIGVGGLLILSTDPVRALWFVILMVVLQQIEGNLIYPRVVGRFVRLPGVWVLIAVTVGSALGLGWMLVSVPLASVVYSLLRDVREGKETERKVSP